MGVLVQFQYFNVVQLDVEVLVDRLQDTTDADVILKLDCDGLVGERLKEAAAKSGQYRLGSPSCVMNEVLPEEKHDCGGERLGRTGEKNEVIAGETWDAKSLLRGSAVVSNSSWAVDMKRQESRDRTVVRAVR